jgi:hypothetical protein
MLSITVRTNLKAFTKGMDDLAKRHIPYATARALNGVAQKIVTAQKENEARVLDRPTPFTTGSVRFRPASKTRQAAVIFMMDKAAKILTPYEFGGVNVPVGKAFLEPVASFKDLNRYGNLPRGFIAKMKGRTDVFVGKVKTRHGWVDGLWQRAQTEDSKPVTQTRISKTGRVSVRKVAGYPSSRQDRSLRLLVAFKDPHPIRQHLDWFRLAAQVVAKEYRGEFEQAMAHALRTAR